MALRSVWVGGVCNFMLVQNKHFSLPLSESKKKIKPRLHVWTRC